MEQIKAEELRIGNWLLHWGEKVQITGINPHSLFFKGGHSLISDFKPIPLAPEILEKWCDWRKWNKDDDYWMDGSCDFKIVQKYNAFHLFHHCEVDGSVWYIKTILYLHDFQNTVKALTDRELTCTSP